MDSNNIQIGINVSISPTIVGEIFSGLSKLNLKNSEESSNWKTIAFIIYSLVYFIKQFNGSTNFLEGSTCETCTSNNSSPNIKQPNEGNNTCEDTCQNTNSGFKNFNYKEILDINKNGISDMVKMFTNMVDNFNNNNLFKKEEKDNH
ncbi:MAG: hypothetical protein QXV60_00680 [Nitrososphaerota archaeon]